MRNICLSVNIIYYYFSYSKLIIIILIEILSYIMFYIIRVANLIAVTKPK